MLATTHKLIPLAVLHKHEAAVLRGLDSLPISYSKRLLDEPEIRYPFLYYALLTHWPELVHGISTEDLVSNRLYWFFRMSKRYEADHDFDAGYQQQTADLFDFATRELGEDAVREIGEKVDCELRTNEQEIAVAYSSFSISKVLDDFNLNLDNAGDFFANVAPIAVSPWLSETLNRSASLALAIDTEKARSEMIVAPILLEVRHQLDGKISLFSGVEWDVDGSVGLRGRCDFLMALTPHQLLIKAPVLAIVEVKNDDTTAGIAQCLAEMVAARIFNQRHGNNIPTIYGIVTTGSTWKFLRLIDNTAYIDATEYYINELQRVVGIIVSMFTASGIALKA